MCVHRASQTTCLVELGLGTASTLVSRSSVWIWGCLFEDTRFGLGKGHQRQTEAHFGERDKQPFSRYLSEISTKITENRVSSPQHRSFLLISLISEDLWERCLEFCVQMAFPADEVCFQSLVAQNLGFSEQECFGPPATRSKTALPNIPAIVNCVCLPHRQKPLPKAIAIALLLRPSCNVRAFFLQNFLWHRQWRNYESKVTHTCHANITCPLATCSRRKPPAQSESAAASKLLEGIGNRLAWHSERQSPSSACPASWVPSSSSKVRYCPRLQTQAMCEHVSLQTSW